MQKVLIIIPSQHETRCEAVPRMCTNHLSGKVQVMGRRCVLHLVTLLRYLPKRTECAAVYPANLKQSWCVGESRIADISESPVCRVSLRQGCNSRVVYLSVARRRSLSMQLTDRGRQADETRVSKLLISQWRLDSVLRL